jgi:cytochrome P450
VTNLAQALDPYDPGFQQEPFRTYARLRADEPVAQVPGQQWYVVSSMALVRQVLQDPDTFANGGVAVRRSQPPPEVAEELAAIRAQGLPYRPALGVNDPPSHTRYRRLVNRAFTPRALAWMEPLVRATAQELAEALPDGEVVDIVAALTRPLPIWAILRIFGMSDDRRADVERWSAAATASLGSRLSADEWLAAERDVLDFQQQLSLELDDRRAHPGEDLLSTLVAAAPGEEPLGNGDLVWLLRELLVAGNETTTRTLAEIVLQLDRTPGSWSALRDAPDRVGPVVEEGLRLSSPALGMFRRATRTVELGGVVLPEGAAVFLAFGSANRDEQVFDDPDAFDPDRARLREHVAFGHGIHVCVGAGLARMEAAAALTALAASVDALEVQADRPLRYLPSFLLRGLVELPVRVRRRGIVLTAETV